MRIFARGLELDDAAFDMGEARRQWSGARSARPDAIVWDRPSPAWLPAALGAPPLPRESMADFPAALSLGALDGANGFRLRGIDAHDVSGAAVASAGDVNGDGFADIIIGAPEADPGGDEYAGETYVMFGKAGGFAASASLATLDGSNGFRLNGIAPLDLSGQAVGSAGDVNGDGFDDIIIGAPGADPGGEVNAGETCVIFGKAGGFAARFDLARLDGANGFRLIGVDAGDQSGLSASSAGDLNGDGFADLVIGAPNADVGGNLSVGVSYVVLGKAGGFSSTVDLAALDGSNGFRLNGIDPQDYSGLSIASAGDVNGDGLDDLVIGAQRAEPGAAYDTGECYVVFGKTGGSMAAIDLATLDGDNGFRLEGAAAYDLSGCSVASAGDVNGDGFDDLIIGARGVDGDTYIEYGRSYLVFGKGDGFAPTASLASVAIAFNGVEGGDQSGFSVASAGDVNSDGYDDLIIGAPFAGGGGGDQSGESHVVFGHAGAFGAIDLAALDGANGFRVDGDLAGGRSGQSVSSAGDVNGDGFDDIVIGAPSADPGGESNAGESYVVFGRAPTAAVERIGSDADQEIRGGDFSDTLWGLMGVDTLYGGGGHDSLDGGGFDDMIHGGAGHDFILGNGNAGLSAGNDTMSGEAGNDTIQGSGAGGTADVMDGGKGVDTLFTAALGLFTGYVWDMKTGATNVVGETAVNFENAVTSADFELADSITGNGAANDVRTNDGDDRLIGRGGADTLAGGTGKDKLRGDGGADDFELASLAAADADKILDFAHNEDRIALEGSVFGLTPGALAPGRFALDAAGDGNDRLIYKTATGKLFFDPDGTGAQKAVLIATLTGAPTLDAGDFIVI